MKHGIVLLILSLFVSTVATAEPVCEFNQWTEYKNTKLKSHPNRSAYVFTASHMRVDADGAPNAYHPNDIGLDYLANAGYPKSSWWSTVLVPDPANPDIAYAQTSGQYAGYFISKTSLQDKSKKATDPARYVDANKVPYLVFPGSFLRMQGSGKLGDLGVAINPDNGKKVAFVVADIGPSTAQLGEVSIALAERLGGTNVNPKNGAGVPKGDIIYMVFPNSSRSFKWPLSDAEIEQHANQLLRQAGGEEALMDCKDTL